MHQAIESNPVSSTWRVSGKQSIQSCEIVSHDTKHIAIFTQIISLET